MRELFSFLVFVFIIIGELFIISTLLKEKNFTILKKNFIRVYLLIGLNVPLIIYGFLLFKAKQPIPILSPSMAIYEWGLCLIGFTATCAPVYKFIKNQFIAFFYKKKPQNVNQNNQK